jgi:uncharacterized protein
MTTALRPPVGTVAALSFLALLVALDPPAARGQSFDCQKAGTAVEHAICGDAGLRRLDSGLSKNYRAAAKMMVPEDAKAFAATQRAWVTERDKQCATGDVACLTGEYRERDALLLALLARTSDDNPVIDRADPAVITGTWVVADGPAGGEASPVLHLPPPGARLVAKPGQLCVVAPEDAKVCNAFGLEVEQKPPPAELTKPDQKVKAFMLSYFDGKADFELIAGSDRDVIAVFQACDDAGNNCRWVGQPWHAASDDAAVRIFHVFE